MFLRNAQLQFQILSHTMYGNTRNFVIFFSLRQLISCPACISCSNSTIIDHILTSYPDRVSQKGIIDIGIPDH